MIMGGVGSARRRRNIAELEAPHTECWSCSDRDGEMRGENEWGDDVDDDSGWTATTLASHSRGVGSFGLQRQFTLQPKP